MVVTDGISEDISVLPVNSLSVKDAVLMYRIKFCMLYLTWLVLAGAQAYPRFFA
jgi:hypothetical protein